MFTKVEKVFWQGEFIFGDREALKLSNMVLKISPIVGIGNTDIFWNKSNKGYRISNLKRREADSDTYTARIYLIDREVCNTTVGGKAECLVEIISPSALKILVTDNKGEYTQKLCFDTNSKSIKEPNSPNLFAITNYQYVEVNNDI